MFRYSQSVPVNRTQDHKVIQGWPCPRRFLPLTANWNMRGELGKKRHCCVVTCSQHRGRKPQSAGTQSDAPTHAAGRGAGRRAVNEAKDKAMGIESSSC